MAPTASAHSAAIADVGDPLDQREGGAGLADRGAGVDAHTAQRHFGGAQAVDRTVAAHGDAVRGGIDQKEPDAVAVALAAGESRRHDEFFRAIAV